MKEIGKKGLGQETTGSFIGWQDWRCNRVDPCAMQGPKKQETGDREKLFCEKSIPNEVYGNFIHGVADRKWCHGKCDKKGCEFTFKRGFNILVGRHGGSYAAASVILQIRPLGDAK